MSTLRERVLRLAAVSAALGVVIFFALLIAVDQFGAVDRAQPADVIVLLGSMVFPGGWEKRFRKYTKSVATCPMSLRISATGSNRNL